MGGKWTPSITVTDTTTLKDVVENIASMHGLSVTYVDTAAQTALKNHVIGVATAAELTEQSERDVLGYCVGCAGMSARVNTVGKLYISWFFSPGSTYDYTVTADVQWENGFKSQQRARKKKKRSQRARTKMSIRKAQEFHCLLQIRLLPMPR